MAKITAPAPDRGDVSRQKLIEAAIKIFGQYGFEGASTRQITSEAGVNIAAIPYYFGGKEGLYCAAIDSIIDYFKADIGPVFERIQNELAQKSTSEADCRKLLQLFVREMTRFVLGGNQERIHISRIISREQLDPTPAFDQLYNGLLRGMHETLASLVVRLTGISPKDPTLKLRTQALLGQVVAFKSSRETVLRNMGWKAFGPKEIDTIAGIVQFHVDAIIAAYQDKK